jgi:NAD(P)-dependent dehydrogenase (short-subunit alcohol dehydrogenase family)
MKQMDDQVVIVTGGTGGIGKITALELARMGASVVIVSRNEARCAETVEEIRQATGSADVAYIAADLSSRDEVVQAAEQFKMRYDRLDVLVNNAGAIFSSRRLSSDGFEMTFALNHLGYFWLTDLLLDVLKASAPARIVNVSSAAHRGAVLDFDDLQSANGYNPMKAYGRSKLMNILFTRELARRLEGKDVTANALHPGFVATSFGVSNGGVWKGAMRIAQLFAISPEKGAETSIYLASSPEVAAISGEYFDKRQIVRPSEAALDDAAARRLWEISVQMAGVPEAVGEYSGAF